MDPETEIEILRAALETVLEGEQTDDKAVAEWGGYRLDDTVRDVVVGALELTE